MFLDGLLSPEGSNLVTAPVLDTNRVCRNM